MVSVILASLKTSKEKAINTTIRADVSGVKTAFEIYYRNEQTYAGGCMSPDVARLLDQAAFQGTGFSTCNPLDNKCVCNDTGSAWAVSLPLKIAERDNRSFWCADSSGNFKDQKWSLNDGDYVCE